MKALVVYANSQIGENFEHGLAHGIWGFKPPKSPPSTFQPGDWLIFGRAFTGGSPRVPAEVWFRHSFEEIVLAKITSELVTETQPEWPDERRSGIAVYTKRLRFSDIERFRGPVSLTDPRLSSKIGEMLRRSAISGKGYVVDVESKPFGGPSTATPAVSEIVRPPIRDVVVAPSKPDPGASLIDIENYIRTRGFNFGSEVLRSFYAALHAKPFVILAGNSGTGKSRLARLFAEAIGANGTNGRFLMIPVRPDWNDSAELLGYFDLNGDYRPGLLIPILLRATALREKPHFVCLDEMNLARVEHYFSDFLSIVESRRREAGVIMTDPVLREDHIRRMKLDGLPLDVVRVLEGLKRDPRAIGIPSNLFIVGTVNMDETTQPFSRKVLDRANTLEFNEIDLEEGLQDEGPETPVAPLDLPSGFLTAEFSCLNDVPREHRETAGRIASFLQAFNGCLSPAGLEVGYRVRDESIAFAIYALGAGMSLEEAQECIVLQKVLPRVQGSSPRIETALLALANKLGADEEIPVRDNTDYTEKLEKLRGRDDASPVLRKIAGMLLIFREEGFTSFWLA